MSKRTWHPMVLLCCLLISVWARADVAPINGIQMYYEVHGAGTPVVMLHGGYDDSDMWQVETWLLSFQYQVIEIDSRGHGRSTGGLTEITYERMASDTLALLDYLGVENAHFVGWSDGAVIASQIAASHPERVNQLILFGAAFQGDAYVPFFEFLLKNQAIFNEFIDNTFGVRYAQVSPEPENWPVFRNHLRALWLSECYNAAASAGFCLEPLQQISAPTLVVAGDLEVIKRSHTEAIATAIPGAELKIVPLAGHFLPKFRPFLTTDIIRRFLNN